MAIPVLIDTDTGIDDAVAIALAATLPELNVVAITTVHGNVEVARATRNAREVARRAGLGVRVTTGAGTPLCRPARPARETHGPEGLGYVQLGEPGERDAGVERTEVAERTGEADTAPETIIAAAESWDRLTLCCLGPLTNVARALERDPSLRTRLGPLFCMGGALAVRGTQTRWSEFNWWSDPEAAARVLAAGLDVRLVPLDVTRRIAIPGSAIATLRAAGAHDDDARFWAEALRFYAEFHRAYEAFDGCVVNDPLAVALIADPALARWRAMRLAVSCTDDEYRGAVREITGGGAAYEPNASVAVGVRAEAVLALLERNVFGRWLSCGALAPGADAAARWLDANPVGTTGDERSEERP